LRGDYLRYPDQKRSIRKNPNGVQRRTLDVDWYKRLQLTGSSQHGQAGVRVIPDGHTILLEDPKKSNAPELTGAAAAATGGFPERAVRAEDPNLVRRTVRDPDIPAGVNSHTLNVEELRRILLAGSTNAQCWLRIHDRIPRLSIGRYCNLHTAAVRDADG
jgi:hypothetical protein